MKSSVTEKPQEKKVSVVGWLVGAMSLFASIIGIYIFFSGFQSFPEAIQAIAKARNTLTPTPLPATPTPLPPTATFTPSPTPLLPLIKGTFYLTFPNFGKEDRLGINFQQAKAASTDVPADLTFSYCEDQRDASIECDLTAVKLWYLGKLPLQDVISFDDSTPINLDDPVIINEGDTFAVIGYDGHPVKFRIAHIMYIDDSLIPKGAKVTIEYIYQTNSRKDFVGP